MPKCPAAYFKYYYYLRNRLDKLTAAVGMSDTFEIQYQQEVVRITTCLENGSIAMPNMHGCAEIMAQSNIDALHPKHVRDVAAEAKLFREEAK